MDFLQGFTDCWWPGPSCRVSWTAVGAAATALGVITALFGPSLLHWFRSLSGTKVLASAWVDVVRKYRGRLFALSEEFPLTGQEDSWVIEGMLLASVETRDDLAEWHSRLRIDRSEYAELANWPSARISLVQKITEALSAVDRVAVVCAAVHGAARAGEEEWATYVQSFNDTISTAEQRCDAAIAACDKLLAPTFMRR